MKRRHHAQHPDQLSLELLFLRRIECADASPPEKSMRHETVAERLEKKKEFSQSLKDLREINGWTIIEMQQLVSHVSRAQLYRWLTGDSAPDSETQVSIIAKLGSMHGLTWDNVRQRWKLRITLDAGKKVVGKRVCMNLKTANAAVATQTRDAVIEAFRQLGLTVRERHIARKSDERRAA